MNVKNGYITGCNSADNQPGDTVFAKVFGVCAGEYQGEISIPGCGEHRFHFTIDCNANITKEFEITCE